MRKVSIILLAFALLIAGCSQENEKTSAKKLTIFFINDQHAQLDNFAKIKHIIDLEKEKTDVITVCGGDMFSGNPVVDNYDQKGFPMIDVMNRVGFDISALGNHEFDYGQTVLAERMEQADFEWVCANVDMETTGIPQPLEYKTISIADLKITFLGLIETDGSATQLIPSTHPWRLKNLSFTDPKETVAQYSELKTQENSDLYIALTHVGFKNDTLIASQHPFFDLMLGGHSHQKINDTINKIPILQSGSYLNYLGKIELTIKNKAIETMNFEMIDLSSYAEYDSELKTIIDNYNNMPYLTEVIGHSHSNHSVDEVGCLYTDALRAVMNVDVTFQNTGGVRSPLDEGEITKREIFEISPFNNGTVTYNMTVSEIKTFLKDSHSGFYYSGIEIKQIGTAIEIIDLNGKIIPDDTILKLGTNDYIPAVHANFFPETGAVQTLTAAETIISYIKNINSDINYHNCNHYFKYK